MSVKKLTGKIVSDKMNKTVVVAVEMNKKHSVYSKIVKNTRRFKTRNDSDAKLNDLVLIEECRPLSKSVSWKVVGKVKGK